MSRQEQQRICFVPLSPEPVGMYCPSLKGTLELRHFRNDILSLAISVLKQGAVEFNPLLCSCSAPQRELSCRGARALVSLSYMRPLIRTFQQAHRFIYM